MASYHGKTHSEPAKKEQIITEFFAKSLHIILESRCPCASSRNFSGEQFLFSPSPSSSSSSSSSCPPRDKWFNLALKDCPAALENIDFWRQTNIEPMIVDIVLVQRPNDWDPLSFSPKGGISSGKEQSCGSEFYDGGFSGRSEKIIERWVIQYESKENTGSGGCSSGCNRRSGTTSTHALYKKSMLLLRSLYATVRLLPAYKLFRELLASAQIRLYNLGHRISSFVEPFTRREETDMQQFEFTPIETSCGKLCLSVSYQTSVLDMSSELSTPLSPQFITEYVGSPLAEPLKKFPSGPVLRSSAASSPRRHSWSHDLYRVSPPSVNPSPSPTYSEPHASISKQRHHRPPIALPRQLQYEAPEANLKNPSSDEYWLSPAFSTSPPPSPTHNIRGNVNKSLVRCESAPVSIPLRFPTMPPLPNHQIAVRSPPVRGSRFSPSNKDAGVQRTISVVAKLGNKDESGVLTGLKPSSSSLLRSFSGSSGRLSFQNDFGDSDFSGPFVVDDDHMMNQGSSSLNPSGNHTNPNPHEHSGASRAKKSQDAAVSALVHMLKKAPPLHHHQSSTPCISQGSPSFEALKSCPSSTEESASPTSGSSAMVASKTITQALEELRAYSEMKDKLLKQCK